MGGGGGAHGKADPLSLRSIPHFGSLAVHGICFTKHTGGDSRRNHPKCKPTKSDPSIRPSQGERLENRG